MRCLKVVLHGLRARAPCTEIFSNSIQEYYITNSNWSEYKLKMSGFVHTMAGMQNMCVIWKAGNGCVLKSVMAHVLEMRGSGSSRKGTGTEEEVRCTTVAENSVTKAEL